MTTGHCCIDQMMTFQQALPEHLLDVWHLVDGIYTEIKVENTDTHVQNNVDTVRDGYRLYYGKAL